MRQPIPYGDALPHPCPTGQIQFPQLELIGRRQDRLVQIERDPHLRQCGGIQGTRFRSSAHGLNEAPRLQAVDPRQPQARFRQRLLEIPVPVPGRFIDDTLDVTPVQPCLGRPGRNGVRGAGRVAPGVPPRGGVQVGARAGGESAR